MTFFTLPDIDKLRARGVSALRAAGNENMLGLAVMSLVWAVVAAIAIGALGYLIHFIGLGLGFAFDRAGWLIAGLWALFVLQGLEFRK